MNSMDKKIIIIRHNHIIHHYQLFFLIFYIICSFNPLIFIIAFSGDVLNCPYYYNIDKTSCLTSVPAGYYCNDESAKTIARCNIDCSTCDATSQNSNKCLSCNNADQYYGKYTEVSNQYKTCYHKNTVLKNFFLDSANNIFKPCFHLCTYCTGSGDTNDHKCTECISGYAFNTLLPDSRNCYEICQYYYNIDKTSCLTSVPDGYYCNDESAKTIAKCDSKCSTCNKQSQNLNKCLSCNNANQYYGIYNEISNQYKSCYLKNDMLEGLYFDSANNIFKPCFQTCKYCTSSGDTTDHKCTECKSGYAFNTLLPNSNNCYERCQYYYNIDKTSCLTSVPAGYYCNDENEKTIAKCNDDCSTCDKQSHNSNKCLSCNNANQYYGLYNEINNQYKSCFLKRTKLEGLFFNQADNIFDQCFHTCKYCTASGDINNHKCTECISGYSFNSLFPDSKNCYEICQNYYNIDKTSCLTSVPVGYYCNDESAKTIAKCNDECSTCDKQSHNSNKCLTCNNANQYFGLYNETNINYKSCFLKSTKLEGLFFNQENNIFEKCFHTCKSCSTLGNEENHQCEECIIGYDYNSEVSKNKNCYEICNCNIYFDSLNKLQCTKDDKCPKSYKLIAPKKKCVKNCNEDNIYTCEYKNECLETCPSIENFKEKILNIFNKNDTINNLNNFLTLQKNGSMNDLIEYILIKDEELILQFDNSTYHLTSSKIQNIKKPTKTNTVIKLGSCETILKEKYKIDKNDSLLIFKLDIPAQGVYSFVSEYEVYHPITLELLNLSFCDKNLINKHVYAPINANEIFKHDSKSDFYNKICYSSSNNNSDLIIDDRREEFVKNSLSLCEPKCKLIDYINETQEAICECDIKKQFLMVSDVYFSKGQFFEEMKKIDYYINLKVLKCYKYIFSKSAFLEINFGNYICIPTIFIFIVFAIIFLAKGFSKLKLQIIKFVDKLEKMKSNKTIKIPKKNITKKLIQKNRKKIKSERKKNLLRFNNNLFKKERTDYKNGGKKSVKSSERKINKSVNKEVNKEPKKNRKQNKLNTLNFNGNKNNNKKNNNNSKITIDFTDSEMNSFTYEEALKTDFRSCTQYYFSLLRTKHLLIFTFYQTKDYNSLIIKISLLLFSIDFYYIINALFYNDLIIHKIYENQGIFRFVYRIPQIIYSTLITILINSIIELLSLSEKNVIKIKKENIINMNVKKKLFKILTIKFICFYFFGILFLSVFWIYLTSFCYVYKFTQYFVIKDASISFALSLIYPFFMNMLPGIFRIPSLRKKNRKCLYQLSKLLQLL